MKRQLLPRLGGFRYASLGIPPTAAAAAAAAAAAQLSVGCLPLTTPDRAIPVSDDPLQQLHSCCVSELPSAAAAAQPSFASVASSPLRAADRRGDNMATTEKIDRTKVCPLLLRCFWRAHGHHRAEEYSNSAGLPKDELQIYTWPDATMREITTLIQDVIPLARKRTARLGFAFVYPDSQGRTSLKEVATVVAVRQGQEDEKTLKELKFQTGDYLDVAIFA